MLLVFACKGRVCPPVQANNEEHPAGLKESVSLQIQEGEH